jgi:hypothetical protein
MLHLYIHNDHPNPVVRIHMTAHDKQNTVITSLSKIHEATGRLSNEHHLAWVPRAGEQNESGEYKSHKQDVSNMSWSERTELLELAMTYLRYIQQLSIN